MRKTFTEAMLAVTLLSSAAMAAQGVQTISVGIDNFPGFSDATIYNPRAGGMMGSANLECGSKWC